MKILLLLLLSLMFSCSKNHVISTRQTIVANIGGCNLDGKCSYMTLDGDVGYGYYPVEGQKVTCDIYQNNKVNCNQE